MFYIEYTKTVLQIEMRSVIIELQLKRKEECRMTMLKKFTFEDVDDLIFTDDTWTRSER